MFMESQKGFGNSLASGRGWQGGFDAQSLSWFHNKIPTIEANAIKSRARHHKRNAKRGVELGKSERGVYEKGAFGASR